jgi:hypothetical protein
MFSSTILDVAVGLIFTFLTVSLLASAVTEAMASAMKWRSATLLTGIKALLNDDQFSGLAKELYNHALVHPRGNGQAQTQGDIVDAPAYVDPMQFAAALIDVANIGGAALAPAVAQDAQLNRMIQGIISRNAGNMDRIKTELASWFDSGMDRVSGAYKRKAQIVSFAVALVAAVFLNVDSIRVSKTLWQQPMVTKAIDSDISIKGKDGFANVLGQLDALGLPIGWPGDTFVEFIKHPSFLWIEVLLGWLITAFATLFGAPFWFDALQQIVRLKGSGPSPAEKQANSGAAA